MPDQASSYKPEEEDEQEDDVDDQHYMSVKDAILFAIDINSSMLQSPPPSDDKKADRDSAAIAALKCAYQLMQQRVISSPNDKMGILLFGTKKSRFFDDSGENTTGLQYPHCYSLMDLDRTGASDIKAVRSIVEDADESAKLLVPSTKPVALSTVLFCANQIFTTRAQNFTSRRLFLVTDNDNPHEFSKDMRSAAVVRAKDLYDLGVTIELFPIAQPGHDFDTGKFYDDIVYRPPKDPEDPAPVSRAVNQTASSSGITLLQSLITSIHSKLVPKRALFANLPLEFSPDFKISVKGYIIFKRQVPKRSGYVYLDGETPRLAEAKTMRVADDTGRSLEKTEIKRAFQFGGESVLFAEDELKSITYFGDPVIRILGFKPIEMLPDWARVKPATFIYPSEEEYVGSTRTFSALQQTLLRKGVMGLVWFIARRNAAPVIAALLPGAEKLGQQGEQIIPPGLWLYPLPFADDIRNNPETNTTITAPDVLKDKMRLVVQQLQLPKAEYDPAKYPNPYLQWHYRVLQAMALNEDMPETPDDKTIPRHKQIHKRAGSYVIDWGNTLQSEFASWQRENRSLVTGSKRETPKLTAPAAKKTRNTAAEDDTPTDEQMRGHWSKGTVAKLKMPELKGWLKGKRLEVGGKKGELVERVEGWFEGKMDLD